MADESKGDGCCPAGSHPELILDEEATLAGKVVTLPSGLVTYQVPAADPECKKAIIVIYDVHGFSGGRIKGVNDSLAKSTGLHVIMPDLYGDSVGINDKGGFSSPDGAGRACAAPGQERVARAACVYMCGCVCTRGSYMCAVCYACMVAGAVVGP